MEMEAAMEGNVSEQAMAGHGEPHASNRTYVGVAAVLAVLTALEVMVFFLPSLKPVMVPILLILMAAKFALVVLFFMHLKFDARVFSGLFAGPLLIAAAIISAMIFLYINYGAGKGG
jgi:cytochrome c oxidase subunit 4